MRCGYCKQEGHNRRSCIALELSEGACENSVYSMRRLDDANVGLFRSVGTIEGCQCIPCNNFRLFNLPTPEIACQILKDKEIAEKLAHEENKWPEMIIINKTRAPIFIYVNGAEPEFKQSIEADTGFKIKYVNPFEEDEISNYIVTDHDYGLKAIFRDIEPKHILKLVSVEYGTKEEITITQEASSVEDKWREAALKAQYLLHQLDRLGVKNNPNYEPIMDMIQDIQYPPYSEQDKERAGVTSGFTNIHETTGINES